MSKTPECLICNRTDNEIPLLHFTFKGHQIHICSQHIPVLIHKPQQLNELLPGIPEEEG